MLENLANEQRTVVIFESPNRIEKTLQDLYQFFGNRKVAISRELTKMYEEVIRGNLEELSSLTRTWKGEITVVIAGADKKKEEINAGNFNHWSQRWYRENYIVN